MAVKILPDAFLADADRVLRLEREAQMLAALNHTNIAQVFGVLEEPPAVVMEFVTGRGLDELIRASRDSAPRAGLALFECLSVGRQLAEALEAAHECGIIHRDLKPANIRVRDDGVVKVLDFGLAKAVPSATVTQGSASTALQPHAQNSPTFTSPAVTQVGVILGSAAYTTPEQAKGKPVDKRVDIWAFGCVLYEMLAGRSVFGHDSVAETLGAVVSKDPDWTALPSDTPEWVVQLLRRCLERDPRSRLRDIGEARVLFERLHDADREHHSHGTGCGLHWSLHCSPEVC